MDRFIETILLFLYLMFTNFWEIWNVLTGPFSTSGILQLNSEPVNIQCSLSPAQKGTYMASCHVATSCEQALTKSIGEYFEKYQYIA